MKHIAQKLTFLFLLWAVAFATDPRLRQKKAGSRRRWRQDGSTVEKKENLEHIPFQANLDICLTMSFSLEGE